MRSLLLAFCTLASLAIVPPATAGVPTPHLISFQGLARDGTNQPVVSGDVRVRIYDAPTGGALVYDSGTDFTGAVATGVFNVLLGSGTPLLLDNTLQYHLELDINGEEVIGDAAAGRQVFWPNGGDQSRSDLEGRIATMEALLFASCAPGEYDLNQNPADGCEFLLDTDGIYVDGNDPGANDDPGCGEGPVGTCVDCEPCLTIGRGLAEAASTGRSTVYVANSTYNEAVTLIDGKSLLGAYQGGTWERNLNASATILRGESSSGAHRRAVDGTNIAAATLVEGFVVFAPAVAQPGGNSYGIYLSNAGGVTLSSNVIWGGAGGPGADGAASSQGADGGVGTAGGDAIQSPTSSCSAALNRPGGAGGVDTCPSVDLSGGDGGGNVCTPVPNTKFSGLDGQAAVGAGGGSGGDAGDDALLQSGSCTVPPAPVVGAPGSDGTPGLDGGAGAGATDPVGSVFGGHWVGAVGVSGASGAVGRGGGGGGGGGGSDGISPELDVLGGAGGGGGSGACGGGGGGSGNAGGGSFGVFVVNGAAPAIISNVFMRGLGGTGGRGSLGGRRGEGGLGGAGGADIFFCAGPGGVGGNGGAGGHGGGGGGAAGGISCGIFTSGAGTPGYGGLNTFLGGAGGAGGSGGPSLGNAGTAGVAGTLNDTTSL